MALQRRRILPPSSLDQTLKAMGARAPDVDELAAIRALMRGNASKGQQLKAMAYIMSEVCGAGRVAFCGENSHTAAFRSGSQAVASTVAQLADAVFLTFPSDQKENSDDEHAE